MKTKASNQLPKETSLEAEEKSLCALQNGDTVLEREENAGPIVDQSEREVVVPPDGGWGWVVCAASFWTNGTLFGLLNTFGILYVRMLKEYHQEGEEDIAFKTSWVGALQISMTFFMSPVASILVDRFGIRRTSLAGSLIATTGMISSSFVNRVEVLYLTYGFLLGLGSSLIYTPSIVILGHYFKKHLGLVNGIVAFGSGVFTFVLPFGMTFLLDQIGLRHTMRVLSVMYALLIICVFIWKPLYDSRHRELDHYLQSRESLYDKYNGCITFLKKFLNVTIWKNKSYVIWVIALPLSFLGYFIPFVHLPKHTRDVMPGSSPEILVMCLGATSGISRLICGKIADIPRVNRIRMQQVSIFTLGVVTSCIPLAKNFGGLVAIVLIMGICDGCFICLLGPIAFDLLGQTGAAQGLGCLLGLCSFPMTAGPPLAGLLYDHLGSYNIAFIAAGAPPIVGSCILFLIKPKKQQQPLVTTVEALTAMSRENLDMIGEEADPLVIEPENKEDISPDIRRFGSERVLPHIHISDFLLASYKDETNKSHSVPNLNP